jgi:ornithine cyclodeaminase/alanine dehydrogenase
MTVLLREPEVEELLPIREAVEAVEDAFRLLGRGDALNCPRRRGTVRGAVLNVMWALAPSLGAMGVKVYPIVRADVTRGSSFTFLLYGLPDGGLEAILEADTLGQRRTGAASAIATKYLARQDSETLAIFGAGWQAESQVEAVAHVLPRLRRVLVVGRSPERRDRFIAEMRRRTGLPVEAAKPESAVRGSDVIITATGSSEPVFDGNWLVPGTHVNAVGSNFAEKRELDAEALHRADQVVVDSAEVARLESGDLLINGFDQERLKELGTIVAGRAPGRRETNEITVFESHGLALQDLACAVRVLRRALELGAGAELPM